MYDYYKYKETYGNPKPDNARNRSFNKALEEIKKTASTENKADANSPLQDSNLDELQAKIINLEKSDLV